MFFAPGFFSIGYFVTGFFPEKPVFVRVYAKREEPRLKSRRE